jgi:hypothetical protein
MLQNCHDSFTFTPMKTKNRLLRVSALFALAASLALSQSASAQIFVAPGIYAYTSRSAYEAATDSTVDSITFNSLAPKGSFTNYSPSGVTAGGVDFSSPATTSLYAVGPNFVNPGTGATFDFTDSSSPDSVTLDPESADGSSTSEVTATFLSAANSSPVTAVGTDIGTSYSTGTITAEIFVTGDSTPIGTYAYTSPDGSTSGLGFLGFITTGTASIDSVEFSDSTIDQYDRANMTLDNFTYGIVDPAFLPEPSSYALLGLGVLALVIFRRRLIAL